MTYDNMVSELQTISHPEVWEQISYYIKKAKCLRDNHEIKRAKDSMEDAIAVTESLDEYYLASQIQKYLKYFK